MNKEFEYDKKMDEVCSRYTHDIIEEIEDKEVVLSNFNLSLR